MIESNILQITAQVMGWSAAVTIVCFTYALVMMVGGPKGTTLGRWSGVVNTTVIISFVAGFFVGPGVFCLAFSTYCMLWLGDMVVSVLYWVIQCFY